MKLNEVKWWIFLEVPHFKKPPITGGFFFGLSILNYGPPNPGGISFFEAPANKGAFPSTHPTAAQQYLFCTLRML